MSIESDEDDAGARDPVYAYKPSLAGAMCRFTLRPDAMEWEVGRYKGRLRYDRILAVRVSFRPVTMQSHRFTTEIWSHDAPKIQIASASWRSIVEQQRLDEAYSAFITELHRRMAAAGSTARFSNGLPFMTFWVGVVIFSAVLAGTAALVVRATSLEHWGATGVVAIFFLVFAYQLGNYFYRNRPGRYRPDAIPPAALPASGGG